MTIIILKGKYGFCNLGKGKLYARRTGEQEINLCFDSDDSKGQIDIFMTLLELIELRKDIKYEINKLSVERWSD